MARSGLSVGHLLDGGFAVGRLGDHRVALLFEHLLEVEADQRLIFRNHDTQRILAHGQEPTGEHCACSATLGVRARIASGPRRCRGPTVDCRLARRPAVAGARCPGTPTGSMDGLRSPHSVRSIPPGGTLAPTTCAVLQLNRNVGDLRDTAGYVQSRGATADARRSSKAVPACARSAWQPASTGRRCASGAIFRTRRSRCEPCPRCSDHPSLPNRSATTRTCWVFTWATAASPRAATRPRGMEAAHHLLRRVARPHRGVRAGHPGGPSGQQGVRCSRSRDVPKLAATRRIGRACSRSMGRARSTCARLSSLIGSRSSWSGIPASSRAGCSTRTGIERH